MRKGTQRHAAVIGHPIAHSLSPALFAEFARAAGIELEYRAVDVLPDALPQTLAAWRADPAFVGCNVTMPHKERIVALLDRCTEVARACAAVNVVRRDGSRLLGDNTDVTGIAATLDGVACSVRGNRAVVFGAGGGARAVVTVLGSRKAAHVAIGARSIERARALAAAARADWPATAFTAFDLVADSAPPADLYVNATPLGQRDLLRQDEPWHPLLPATAPAGALAFDLVYRPAFTPFLGEARGRGLRTVGGFTMLLEQALATFQAWLGFRPALDAAARIRLEKLAA